MQITRRPRSICWWSIYFVNAFFPVLHTSCTFIVFASPADIHLYLQITAFRYKPAPTVSLCISFSFCPSHVLNKSGRLTEVFVSGIYPSSGIWRRVHTGVSVPAFQRNLLLLSLLWSKKTSLFVEYPENGSSKLVRNVAVSTVVHGVIRDDEVASECVWESEVCIC
jgi:hypothetical protein